jgi:hypothetical protein
MTKETLENKYKTYCVEFPYTCSFTFPDDGNHTKVTIESRSQVIRYGRNEQDIKLQLELDKEHSKPTCAKHLIKWVNDRLRNVDPRKVSVEYGINPIIRTLSKKELNEFREDCLNDE